MQTNTPKPRKPKNSAAKTIPQILKDNVCTLFNLLNFIIAVALALVGAWSNLLFFLIIALNTVIGIVQEIKAKRLIEKLTLLSMSAVTILKDGKEVEIMPDDAEKGDILLLHSGEVICADSVMLDGYAEVNEAILTGESEPVVKKAGDKLLSGSTVIAGKCTAEITCSNEDSYANKLVDEVKKAKSAKSELMQSMRKVTKFTGFIIIPVGVIMFIQALLIRNNILYDSVVSTSAALLGMLPKGLVLLITIGLAAGVIKLSKKNILVQDLFSLENLAHCDMICLDKTGTITEGKMAVEKIVPLGSNDTGLVTKLMSTYVHHTTDNNSTFHALKDYFEGGDTFDVSSTVPFSSDRKWSAVMLSDGRTMVMGAYEKLGKGSMPSKLKNEAEGGKRVLVVGLAEEVSSNSVDPEKVELLAAVILTDPIRKNAQETIQYFYKQGVAVKVISGDDPTTVAAVAERAGIDNAHMAVDMTKVRDEDIPEAALKYTVFGRVTPNQKKILVSELQKAGHNVAMTGDGVNDLLAMKQANCSIAVGQGSDAARQTAQLVLLDSDFSVLKDVIAEGRRVINNLTKSAGVFFIKTIYSVLISILCIFLNTDFPFIPLQITLIDAVIEGFPAFFMSFEQNDKQVHGTFLNNALRSAMPNALAILISYIVLYILSFNMGISDSQVSLIIYLTVGAVSLLGVVKASMPFNKFRLALAVISIVGFTAAILLFSSFLELPAPEPGNVPIMTGIIILGLVVTLILDIPRMVKAVKAKKQ